MAAPSGALECIAEAIFGEGGNAAVFIQSGWANPERGFTWTLGETSTLILPTGPVSGAHEHWLEMRLNPFRVPGTLNSQRLGVTVNGVLLANDVVTDAATLTYGVPNHLLTGGPAGIAQLILRQPDSAQPCALSDNPDTRPLGFMLYHVRLLRRVKRPRANIMGLPPIALPQDEETLRVAVMWAAKVAAEDLVKRFESLGRNCEFGLVQRRLGAEPLGFLRFSAISLEKVLEGVRAGFAGLGERLQVTIEGQVGGRPGDYMVRDERYHLSTHSFTEPGKALPEAVRERVGRHMKRLRDDFFERLEEGGRIAVIHRPGVILAAEARALHLALQDLGDTALLFVDQSAALPCGAVNQLDYGLFHGKLDWFGPLEDVGQSDLAGWMSLCINAARLWEQRGGA